MQWSDTQSSHIFANVFFRYSRRARGFAHTHLLARSHSLALPATLPPAALVVPVGVVGAPSLLAALQSGVERAHVHTSSEGTAAASTAALFFLSTRDGD